MKVIILGFIVFNILNIPLYIFLYRQFYPVKRDFRKAISYSLTPDVVSLARGKFRKDISAEWRLKFFLLICVVVLVCEIQLLQAAIKHFS